MVNTYRRQLLLYFNCCARKAVRMSAVGPSLQAQVESVLSALVKAATVELTRLFESRYGASVAAVDVGRTEVQKETRTAESSSVVSSKHSVGVQVDQDVDPLQEFGGLPFFSNHQCPDQCKEEEEEEKEEQEEEEKGCPIPIGLLLAEENDHVGSARSSPNTQNLADSTESVTTVAELGVLETKNPTDRKTQLEVVRQVCMDTPAQSSTKEETPLILLAKNSDGTAGESVTFVCPLILKPGTPGPKPESLKEPVEVEPHQACVSTAKGTAYSPSPSDGAVTPLPVGLWEQVHASKKPNGSLNMKLKLTSPDQKLLRTCAVELVNILTIPDSHFKAQDNPKTGYPLPKDLRRHQGLHTGHRLCCFNPCENGVWRLQGIVAHCRDGYTCGDCGKTFKHRKILRRHERFHTGEKPYQCVSCAKTFALKKSLRRHLRFHTGEKPHTCTQCNKSFRLRDNLKAHLRFHSGEKPFSCTTCGKMFRIRRNLEKHTLSQCGFFVPSFKMIAGR